MKKLHAKRQSQIPYFTMALPCILVVLVFNYLPMVGIVLAFKDYRLADGVFGSRWVGLENFSFFFKSGVAWRLVRNTVDLNFLFMVTMQLAGNPGGAAAQ